MREAYVEGLLQSDMADPVNRLALADWYEETGQRLEAALARALHLPIVILFGKVYPRLTSDRWKDYVPKDEATRRLGWKSPEFKTYCWGEHAIARADFSPFRLPDQVPPPSDAQKQAVSAKVGIRLSTAAAHEVLLRVRKVIVTEKRRLQLDENADPLD